MNDPDRWTRLAALARTEWRHLTTFRPSDRLWQMPFAAALALGVPLMVGAGCGSLGSGLVASLGGLSFLYLPNTPLAHRMIMLMACGFGMVASYTLGAVSQFFPPAMTVMLAFIAVVVTMTCRLYRVGPPGSLFFVMAASIGAFSPFAPAELPRMVGLVALGALLAGLIAFFYSLYAIRRQAPVAAEPIPPPDFDFVVFDSIVIGAFVGIALAVAQALQLDRPYWVPVSCLAVIQGASLRAVWEKQLHRVLGTCAGLLLSWALLALPMNAWGAALTMTLLAFVIETLVVRHYGFAVVFITPLTLFLAEAATIGQGPVAALVQARLVDTLLGCLMGLAGGVCVHSPRFRAALGSRTRRLLTGSSGAAPD